MATPKRKVSHSRKMMRRSQVSKLAAPTMVECPNCHELTAPHKVCAYCGFYDGKEVLKDGKLATAEPAKAEKKADKKDAE
jgi:large subunit ribosomal protein L32